MNKNSLYPAPKVELFISYACIAQDRLRSWFQCALLAGSHAHEMALVVSWLLYVNAITHTEAASLFRHPGRNLDLFMEFVETAADRFVPFRP